MSPLVNTLLLGWVAIVLLLFTQLPPLRAIIAAFVVSWLFLPEATINLPGVPDYGKLPAASLGALLGALIFDLSRVLRFRPSIVDVPLVLWVLAPIPTSLANDLGLYDGLSGAWVQTLKWGIPMLLGRIYFRDAIALRELAAGLVMGATIYVPLCILEIRLSPQLHRWVYGYHQHEFQETIRYGGFRPTVFMDNGLAVSAFMSCGAFLCFWLWRSGEYRRLIGVPLAFLTPVLAATTILCKSANGMGTLLVGVASYFALKTIGSRWPLLVLAAVSPCYMLLRTSGKLPAESLVQLVAEVDAQRAQSLGARLEQEDHFSDHTWQRPIFGWGGWMRNFPRTENGELMTRGVDAMWTIALSTYGVFGLVSWSSSMLMGPTLYSLCVPPRRWMAADCLPCTALAVLCFLWCIDNLFNGLLQPMFVLAMGGLTTFALQWERSQLRRGGVHSKLLARLESANISAPRRRRWGN